MKEIALYFLKIGILGFGGPLAHIAMMQDELVEKRKWLSKEQFLDGLALCNLLPGPASTQLGIYIGMVRHGIWGGILAGIAFIFPAFLLMLVLSALYFQTQMIVSIRYALYGINAVVIAIIAFSLYKMGRKAILNSTHIIVAIACFTLAFLFSFHAMVILLFGAILYWFIHSIKGKYFVFEPISIILLLTLFGYFIQVGSLIFGGGLVIIPFIRETVVVSLGWLSEAEFLVGLSLGEITPGPIVITAAFIGYKVAGIVGAGVVTVGIFLPSFFFILISARFLDKIRSNLWVKEALSGINAAVIGLIGASVIRLAFSALFDPFTIGFMVLSLILLYYKKISIVSLVLLAGVISSGFYYLLNILT